MCTSNEGMIADISFGDAKLTCRLPAGEFRIIYDPKTGLSVEEPSRPIGRPRIEDKGKFDRTAYQREYMRKWRAARRSKGND